VEAEGAAGFAENGGEAFGLGSEDRAARRREAIAAAWFRLGGVWGDFFDEVEGGELFDVVVERTGADLVLAAGLAGYLEHDAVAVKVAAGEGEQDVERGGGEREVFGGVGLHIWKTIYRIPNSCQIEFTLWRMRGEDMTWGSGKTLRILVGSGGIDVVDD
jgi:hypothetical protein